MGVAVRVFGEDSLIINTIATRRLLAVAVTAAAFGAASCRRGNEDASSLSYLTNSDETCATYSAERMDYIKALPATFLTGYSGAQMDIARSRLAGISDRDLDHLLYTHQKGTLSGIHPALLFFGVAGLTYLTSGQTQTGFRGMVATSITTGDSASGFALQHEIGHATEIVAQEAAQKTEFANFDAALNQMHSEMTSKSSLIRDYARSSPAEAWAEAYANFHCSPASQAFIKANLPFTFKFLSAVLPPARFSAPATPPPPGPPANSPPPTAVTANPSTGAGTSSNTGGQPGSSAAFGGWLDDLLKKDYPAVLTAKDPADPAGDAQVNGSNNVIRLALVDVDTSGGLTEMMFAADVGITQIMLCFADEATCRGKVALAPDDQSKVIAKHQDLAGRGIFTARYVRHDQTKYLQGPWFALGYDQEGKLVGARKFSLVEKSH